MKENNNKLCLVELIEQEYGAPKFDIIESACRATFWDLTCRTEFLTSPPLDSGNYGFNFNCYVKLHSLALVTLDPSFVCNFAITEHSLRFDELMGMWLKDLFKELGFESDYLYFFNFDNVGHLYLNTDEEQFKRLNALLEDEIIYIKHEPEVTERFTKSELESIRGTPVFMKGTHPEGHKLFAIQRLSKHFLLHMFDNDSEENFFMLYRLKFRDYSRLKCNTIAMPREVMQKKFQELLPKALRCARLRFEYKIQGLECVYIKYATWADYLNYFLGCGKTDPDFFVAHTVSFDGSSIFLNLYVSHPDYEEEFLQSVSKAQIGIFLSKEQKEDDVLRNPEIVGEVICHGLDYVESHIAFQPFEGDLIAYSFQQPQHNFSFQCYKALYRNGLGVELSAYSSQFLYGYYDRFLEEANKRDWVFSKGGPVTI